MRQYLELLNKVLTDGLDVSDRTGVGTKTIFGYQMRFDLSRGKLPLLTTKKINVKPLIYELLWFLKGDTNIKYLNDNGVHIWDSWADENGDIGPGYGAQWRRWEMANGNYSDQISDVIKRIKKTPYSRRLLVSAWNVGDIDVMRLPPCHTMFQFNIIGDKLSCQLYQRSADVFIGVPFNIASYSLLTMMVAHVTGYKPGEFIHTLGNTHLYQNHLDLARLQLEREPYELPEVFLNPSIDNIFDFDYNDIEIKNYKYHPFIKAEVAV